MQTSVIFRRTALFLLALAAFAAMPLQGQTRPLIVPNDVITFSGGAVSPDNPEIYVIDCGVFIPAKTYTLTLNRPKGAQANYPVDIDCRALTLRWIGYYFDEPAEQQYLQNIRFEAGETEKTLSFTAKSIVLENEMITIYVFLGNGNRTQSDIKVVKMNFTNPNPVTPVAGSDDEYVMPLEIGKSFPATPNTYQMVFVGDEEFGHVEVLENTRLSSKQWAIEHEAFPATVSDSVFAAKETLLLKPEQPVGTVTNTLEFLHKMTEETYMTNWQHKDNSYVLQWQSWQADSLINLKIAADGKVTDKYGLKCGDAIEGAMMRIFPRFGAITADAASYNIGDAVKISIPVLNSKLLQKVYNGNEWLDNIDITLDGGLTVFNRDSITYDGVNNVITAIGTAVNNTGTPITASAEIRHAKLDMIMGFPTGEFYYPYGAYTNITITAQTASFHPITSIDFNIPENNQVNLNLKNVVFTPSFNPSNATYKSGVWTSSDTSVGEISATGLFTPKAYGKTTLTYTSSEVAHRTNNALSPNNAVLIRSFDIYVVGDMPAWGFDNSRKSYRTAFENGDLILRHNLREIAWKADGDIKVEIIHPESDKYESLKDVTGFFSAADFLSYRIPFNDQTFPKRPTIIDRRGTRYTREDSALVQPYRIVMSVPLKQTIGGMEMHCVLKDTFDLHVELPQNPQVRLIQDMPPTAKAGEKFLLKYEIKYIPKYLVYPRLRFQATWNVHHDLLNSVFDGEHPYVEKTFEYSSTVPDVVAGIIRDGINPASVPEWLELTDMGAYYNAVATIDYLLPAPLSDKVILGAATYDDFDRNYETFRSNIIVETGILTATNLNTGVETREWDPKNFSASGVVKVHKEIDLERIEKNIIYQNNHISIAQWEEPGKLDQLVPLIDEANTTGKTKNLNTYLNEYTKRNFRCLMNESSRNDLVIGIADHTSNETIYTVPGEYFGIYCPIGGEYDMIVAYPKSGIQKTYPFNPENLVDKLYVLQFAGLLSYSAPLYISYVNGNGVSVEKQHYISTSNTYFIYEPSGIVGNIWVRNEIHKTAGSVKPLHAFTGSPDVAHFTEGSLLISSNFNYYINKCTLVGPELGVQLVDRETGKAITAPARINHIEHVSKVKMTKNREVPYCQGTWQEWMYQTIVNDWKVIPGIQRVITIDSNHNQTQRIYADDDNGREVIKDFSEKVMREYLSSIKYSAIGSEIAGDGNPGKVNTSTNGVYSLPLNSDFLNSLPKNANKDYSRNETLMEILVDGYQPRLAAYGRTKRPGMPELDEFTDGNLVYVPQAGYRYLITVPLSKTTIASSINIWAEKPGLEVTNLNWTPKEAVFNGYQICMDWIGKEPNSEIRDVRNLSKLSSNTVVPYARYADTYNSVLNITAPVGSSLRIDGQYLAQKNRFPKICYGCNFDYAEEKINYKSYGFEKEYANTSYCLNSYIDYDEMKNPVLDIMENDKVKSSSTLPVLFNDETNPAIYASEISKEVKNNIVIKPSQFDVSSFGKNADLGNTKDAMKKMEGMSLKLPDPIPFEFNTRTEGNYYYLRGILSHNFIDDIPLIGQANQGMKLYKGIADRVEEFDAAFGELKKQVGMYRPKHATKRFTNASVFAGLKGYMEGRGTYDPMIKKWDYCLYGGGVTLEMSASAYVGINFVVGKLGVGLDALASLTLGFNKPADEDLKNAVNGVKCDMWLETELSLDVYVDLSVGIDIGIAGAQLGISGSGGFTNKNKVLFKPYLPYDEITAGGLFNVRASMELWAHAYFLWWSWEDSYEIFNLSKTWYYPNNNTNPYLRSTGPAQVRPLRSAYLRSSYAAPNAIITDVAANAYPRYFNDGGSIMFSNLKTPADQNDDRISTYTAGTTADMLPEAVDPAFSFDVATANGVSVAAFEQMNGEFDEISETVSSETQIRMQAQSMDVFAAVKDGGVWKTTQLSDLGVNVKERKADMAPKVAVSPDGTRAAAVWKSGYLQVNSQGAKMTGDLFFSRYNGTDWSAPVYLANGNDLGDYNLAMNGDSVVIATMRVEAGQEGLVDATGRIKLIFVSETDSIVNIETGLTGRKPQIARAGDDYYVSFMGKYMVNDTTKVNDIYLLAVGKNGMPIDSISGFAGMKSNVSFDYKLVSEPGAKDVNDLAILYNTSRVEKGSEVVQSNLNAVKFGRYKGKIFASEPVNILSIPDDGTQLLFSYDGYKNDNNVKAAVSIVNGSHGATIVEESGKFENKIACVSEAFNKEDIKIGKEISVLFQTLNTGYKPVNSFTVKIGDDTEGNLTETELFPSDEQIIEGFYTIPENNTEPVDYTITANFADGTTGVTTGSIDLTAYEVEVKLLSLSKSGNKNIVTAEVINNSPSPLTAKNEVTVGIYGDMFGEDLYPGTSLKTIPIADLYGNDGKGKMTNKVTTVAFEIPEVKGTANMYAFSKVKKDGVLRGEGDEPDDVKQAENKFAVLQIFPEAAEIPTYHFVSFASDNIENVIAVKGVEQGKLVSCPEKQINNGYALEGWYLDNKTFLKKWNFDTDRVVSDTVLWAKWKPAYKVRVMPSGNGAVSDADDFYSDEETDYILLSEHPEGETVTLSIMPDTGYEPDSIVICKTGEESVIVKVLRRISPEQEFTMPAFGVTVIAAFREATPLKRIELLPEGGLAVRVLNTGNTATGNLTISLAGKNADVFTIPSTTISSLDPGDESLIILTVGNLPVGTYTATLTVSCEGLTPVSTEIIYGITSISSPEVSTLKARIFNGTLYVSGLMPGETWGVYNATGVLLHQDIVAGSEGYMKLPARGLYIVTSEKRKVKVVY